jgi:HSP90 family molecular chaperone
MISSKVRQRIQELSNDYYSRLQVIESKAHQLLEYSQAGSQLTYTPHGLSHITAVERNYDWLLLEQDLRKFNAVELFCLVCATFFHDALMIPKKAGDETSARENHIQRASDFLHKNREFLGFSIHEADAVSQIIRGHGVYDLEEIPEKVVIGNMMVDLRKLAACLSLADISHADSSRAPEILFKHLELDEESSYHWRRHLQISGITREEDELVMSALTFSDQGLVAVEEYKEAIEQQLKIVKPYFDTILEPIKRIELFERRLDSPLDQTLQFQTNTPAILRLLIDGVYDREDVFIRELVQNSLDSCLLNKAKQMRRTAMYEPQILITIFTENDEVKALRIDDNGIGMNITDVLDTVLWIGNSISSKEDVTTLLQQTLGKNLIAKFGIGLLSCFKASNNILVRTRKENETPLEFKLTGVSDNIKPVKADDESVGTTIIVEVSKDKELNLNPYEAIRYYFRMVNQVNLKVLDLDWDSEYLLYSRADLFKIALTEAYPTENEYIPTDDDLISYTIQGDDFSGNIWIPENELKTTSSDGHVDILNEGIFVSNDPTNDWFPDCVRFCDAILNFSSKSITLPAGRDKVIRNELFKSKVKDLHEKTFGLIRTLVEKTKNRDVKERDFAALILASVFRKANEDKDKSFRDRIIKNIDNYYVKRYKNDERIILNDLCKNTFDPVYVHYKKGRYVTDLSIVDGKQLYHKEDDLVELQSALLTQEGAVVLATERFDETDELILEANVVKAYLEKNGIRVIDLASENVIEGKQRSKPIPSNVRQYVGTQTKFVEINGLPKKKSWKVGNELWINLANPSMKRVYSALQKDNQSIEVFNYVATLFKILVYEYDEVTTDIINWIDKSFDK